MNAFLAFFLKEPGAADPTRSRDFASRLVRLSPFPDLARLKQDDPFERPGNIPSIPKIQRIRALLKMAVSSGWSLKRPAGASQKEAGDLQIRI